MVKANNLARLIYFLLLIALIRNNAKGQSCTGTLGLPIVNITFGAGVPNPGPRLSAGATNNIAYVSDICPNDGQYSIANSTQGCFSSTWHTTKDHTGNPNGYFMLVNGSVLPSDFYVDTVRNLCPNTTYEFGAWVMNMLITGACSPTPISPNIKFTIETPAGVVLKSYNTGNIATTAAGNPQWNRFSTTFQNVASTKIVLRMNNIAPGGCGNDLALDDITFSPCGPSVNIAISGNNTNTIVTCLGQQVSLNATVSPGYTAPEFQWQDSAGGSWTNIPGANTTLFSVTPPSPGTYFYRMLVAESGNISQASCRVSSEMATLTVNPAANPQFSPFAPICTGSTPPVLPAVSNNGISGAWNPSTVNNMLTGSYTFTPAAGCSQDTTITITVTPLNTIPEFTPVAAFCSGAPAPVLPLVSNNGITGTWDPASVSNTATANYVFTPASGQCAQTVSMNITVASSLAPPTVATPIIYCKNDVAAPLVVSGTNLKWYNTASGGTGVNETPVISTNTVGSKTYYVSQSTGDCESERALITVKVNDIPEVYAGGPAVYVTKGDSIKLKANATGENINILWIPDIAINNAAIMQPTIKPLLDTKYYMTVTAEGGCTAYDTVDIILIEKIFIPNAFSPNGDGIHDVWVIEKIYQYPSAEIKIFNRYGQFVFGSVGYNTAWDGTFKGKPLPTGPYYYIIKTGPGSPPISGSVSLIR